MSIHTPTRHVFLALALGACTATELEMLEPSDCEPQVVESLPSGNHNAGMACIDGGCHDGGTPQAPQWIAAGTIYRGSTPLAGATIELVDVAGTSVMLTSAQNGNFWTQQPLVFPLTATASDCLESRTMPNPAPLGSCNQGGCHDSRRIDLP